MDPEKNNIIDMEVRRHAREAIAHDIHDASAVLSDPMPNRVVFSTTPSADTPPREILALDPDNGKVFVFGEEVPSNDSRIADAILTIADHLAPGLMVHRGTVELIDFGIYEVMGPDAVRGNYGGEHTLHGLLKHYDEKEVIVTVREIGHGKRD